MHCLGAGAPGIQDYPSCSSAEIPPLQIYQIFAARCRFPE
jgi:hypothetical protein